MGCGASVSLAVLFPLSYVGFLHIADHDGTDRNHPQSIQKRSIAAVVNNVLSVAITYFVLWQRNDSSPFRSMGFRPEGTLAAIVWPGILIGVLYTGQWVLLILDGQLRSMFSVNEWKVSLRQHTWIRDVIVGPVTEEITFRCCCVALLKDCVSPTMAIVAGPLPFACSHLHHIGDDRRRGYTWSQAVARRVFQLAYTYLFGAYATYLFLNSGHALAPIVTHAVCNCMGLPLFNEIGSFSKRWQRVLLWTAYASGMCGFVMLLGPLTRPELYQKW
uniref:CAAX prenyl protease 2 n=1 Tax=Haemonchus contortus TaxID=6289 RepID=A0A7I4YYH5_HAECO